MCCRRAVADPEVEGLAWLPLPLLDRAHEALLDHGDREPTVARVDEAFRDALDCSSGGQVCTNLTQLRLDALKV